MSSLGIVEMYILKNISLKDFNKINSKLCRISQKCGVKKIVCPDGHDSWLPINHLEKMWFKKPQAIKRYEPNCLKNKWRQSAIFSPTVKNSPLN